MDKQLPNSSTMDLAIQPREHDLVIGTFGRAAYIIDDIRPLRELAKEGLSLLNKTLHLFKPKEIFITENQQPSGTRFGANAIFNGENRNGSEAISILLNKPNQENKIEPSKKKKKTKKEIISSKEKNEIKQQSVIKYDSLLYEVFDVENKLILSKKLKTPKGNGIHRFLPPVYEKGVHRPSRVKIKPNTPRSFGVRMLPGLYTLKIHFGDQTSTQPFKISYDPRVQISLDTHKAIYDLKKKIEQKMGVASDAMQRLIVSKEIVQDYQKRIKTHMEIENSKDLLMLHTEIIKKIDALMDDLLGKQDKRQGITATEFPSPISRLRTASRYVSSLKQKPGPTELTLVENANLKVSEIISKINTFYEKDWIEYQNSVKKLNLLPFKEFKKLNY